MIISKILLTEYLIDSQILVGIIETLASPGYFVWHCHSVHCLDLQLPSNSNRSPGPHLNVPDQESADRPKNPDGVRKTRYIRATRRD